MNVAQKSAREGRGQDGPQPEVVTGQLEGRECKQRGSDLEPIGNLLLPRNDRPFAPAPYNAKVSFTQAAGERTQDFASNKRQCQAYAIRRTTSFLRCHVLVSLLSRFVLLCLVSLYYIAQWYAASNPF
jgi:hypothetical protein